MRHLRRGVIGIDLSLQRAAAVYLPPQWVPGSWEGVEWTVTGHPAKRDDLVARTERLVHITNELFKFPEEIGDTDAAVFVEDYAYGLAGMSGMALAELGGAVKMVFGEDDVVVVPINSMTARKVFLGKIPQGKGKAQAAIHEAIQRMRPPWGEGSDEGDAFIIANAGRSQLGMTAATIA